MNAEEVQERLERHLTEEDLRADATAQSVDSLSHLVAPLIRGSSGIETLLDLGCSKGGLTAAFAELLDCAVVHGVDIDADRRAAAESRGVTTHDVDLDHEPLPFEDGEVDLVLCFGVLEHLEFYDHLLEESRRVLRDGGAALFSVPNLGSWVNRIALLFGNQPRNVEISQERAFGISGFYSRDAVINHVHAPTYGALLELLEYHGYDVRGTRGLFPYQDRWFVRAIDRLSAYRPSFCRRIAVLASVN